MQEIRQSGSEGGEPSYSALLPLSNTSTSTSSTSLIFTFSPQFLDLVPIRSPPFDRAAF